MSQVTYFTARQKVLEVLNALANIAYTAVPCSAYVPAGTTALIAMTELEAAVIPSPGDYALSTKRKNSAQGVCSRDQIKYDGAAVQITGDNCIIPLTTGRQFEYDLNGVFTGLRINIRVYVIGYIS